MSTEQSIDQVFIKKVTHLIEDNFENEQFGVKELAKKSGMSRSNLHRKLQIIMGKSASRYIREYRLEKAMLLLKEDIATSSEIAYRVGFGSPSYFSKCFHKFYGFPPSEAKYNKIVTFDSKNNSIDSVSKHQKSSIFRIVSISTLVLTSLIVISYLINSYSEGNLTSKTTESTLRDKSIAVLPCISLSDEKENQYFADGQMDAILNHLTKISELRVISRTTMLGYRESTMSIPKIAKELGVKYVLELSAQKSDQKVNIIAQLIDADTDRHLWSNNYVRDLTDIFSIQTDIAKRIAKELSAKITPSELDRIEKEPTYNFEAYKLYLKGRFSWHQRTKKDLNESIYYYNQALKLDSTYALAYAGLADTYYIMAWWGWYPIKDGFMKGEKFAQTALSLDENIAEAHATLGSILCWKKWRWEDAEKELKHAISLNPNSATAHLYYYELLDILGKNKQAREQINIALKLNPHSVILNKQSSLSYQRNENYEKAIEGYKKSLGFATSEIIINSINRDMARCYINLGLNDLAIEHIKIFITDNTADNYAKLDTMYYNSGIEGVMHWLINYCLLEDKNCLISSDIEIASFYSLLGDPDNAMFYLEKSYANAEFILPIIKNNPDFKSIKTDPRFISLLDKMNLGN